MLIPTIHPPPTPALEGLRQGVGPRCGGNIFVPFLGGSPPKNGTNFLPFLPWEERGRGMVGALSHSMTKKVKITPVKAGFGLNLYQKMWVRISLKGRGWRGLLHLGQN